jgi:hypothetical protein
MSDLVEWLETAIGATERVAEAATSGPWVATSHGFIDVAPKTTGGFVAIASDVYADGSTGPVLQADAEHIALNDPAAVLRRCAADRKLIAEVRRAEWISKNTGDPAAVAVEIGLRSALKIVAEGYGYQEATVNG